MDVLADPELAAAGGGSQQQPEAQKQLPGEDELRRIDLMQKMEVEAVVEAADETLSLRAEACELSKLAAPIMTVSMLQFAMVMVDMAMVGRLGTEELAASALANTYFNCLQVRSSPAPIVESTPT